MNRYRKLDGRDVYRVQALLPNGLFERRGASVQLREAVFPEGSSYYAPRLRLMEQLLKTLAARYLRPVN